MAGTDHYTEGSVILHHYDEGGIVGQKVQLVGGLHLLFL